MEVLLSGKAYFNFQVASGISGIPAPSTCLIVQYVESKVYRTCPANTDDLKRNLQCIQGIPKEML